MPGLAAGSSPARMLLAVSLKMYLSAERTRDWLTQVARLTGHERDIDLVVLPTFPLLESAGRQLAGTSIRWGAQDVAPGTAGAQTGEVSPGVLRELGCTHVEVGHAERRRLFGEDDAMVTDKLATALDHGLVPILCVGEPDLLAPAVAAEVVAAELHRLLTQPGVRLAGRELVVAYEPVWAIGAPESASPEHVAAVAAALRDTLDELGVEARVIYGGAAGIDTVGALWPTVDGFFLGRFAHDPGAFARMVARGREVSGADG